MLPFFLSFFLSVFLGWSIPNFITGLRGWWRPNSSCRTQETVPDRCLLSWLANTQLNHVESWYQYSTKTTKRCVLMNPPPISIGDSRPGTAVIPETRSYFFLSFTPLISWHSEVHSNHCLHTWHALTFLALCYGMVGSVC